MLRHPVEHYATQQIPMPTIDEPEPLQMADGGLVAGPRQNPLTPGKPQTPIPDWMRYSLREGREVPGKGEGDKIPALLEPEEFVVSNSMMERKPGLRDTLHDIRDETLVAEGKDPRAVDAKQVRGMMAHEDHMDGSGGGGAGADSYQGVGAAGGNRRHAQVGLRAAEGFPGIEFDNARWREAQHSRAVNPALDPSKPAFHGDGRYGAPAGPAPTTAEAPRSTSYRAGQAARGVGQSLRSGPNGLTGGALAGVAVDSASDSFNTPTENYRRRLGMDPNAASIGGDIVARTGGVMTDLGANILDTPVNAVNSVSKFFGGKGDLQLPGGSFQDIVSRNDGATPAAPAATPAAPAPSLRTPVVPPQPQTQAFQASGPMGPPTDPNAIRVERQANGTTSFSGGTVAFNPDGGNSYIGPGAKSLRGNTPIGVVPADAGRPFGAGAVPGQPPARDPVAEFAAAAPKRGEFGYRQAQNDLARMRSEAIQTRGQDITSADGRYGHELTAANNRARLRYDMNKDQRDYGFSREKFTEEQSKTNFDARQKAQKDITDEIASYLPPGPDGKPDLAAAANHMGALNAHVSSRMEQLQQHLQLNPNDKTAASELQGLQARGVAQLSPQAKREFLVGKRAADVAKDTATGSLTPWGTAAVESDAPIKSLRKQKTLFGHDYISDRGDVIPGRYIDKADTSLGIGGRTNRNYDSLKLRD